MLEAGRKSFGAGCPCSSLCVVSSSGFRRYPPDNAQLHGDVQSFGFGMPQGKQPPVPSTSKPAAVAAREARRRRRRSWLHCSQAVFSPPRGMLNETISHYPNEERLQGLYLTAVLAAVGVWCTLPGAGL